MSTSVRGVWASPVAAGVGPGAAGLGSSSASGSSAATGSAADLGLVLRDRLLSRRGDRLGRCDRLVGHRCGDRGRCRNALRSRDVEQRGRAVDVHVGPGGVRLSRAGRGSRGRLRGCLGSPLCGDRLGSRGGRRSVIGGGDVEQRSLAGDGRRRCSGRLLRGRGRGWCGGWCGRKVEERAGGGDPRAGGLRRWARRGWGGRSRREVEQGTGRRLHRCRRGRRGGRHVEQRSSGGLGRRGRRGRLGGRHVEQRSGAGRGDGRSRCRSRWRSGRTVSVGGASRFGGAGPGRGLPLDRGEQHLRDVEDLDLLAGRRPRPARR